MTIQSNNASELDTSCSVDVPGVSGDCEPKEKLPCHTFTHYYFDDSSGKWYVSEGGFDDDDTPEYVESYFHDKAREFSDYLTGKRKTVPLFSADGQEESHETYLKLMKSRIKQIDPYWIDRYLKNQI